MIEGNDKQHAAGPPPAEPAADPQQAPPAGPPPGGRPATDGGHSRRGGGWIRRKPVQLVAAGLVGGIFGGGVVALAGALYDHPERPSYAMVGRHDLVPYGPHAKRWYGPGRDARCPREWRGPRGERPPMPGPVPVAPTTTPTAAKPSPTLHS